MVKVNNTSLHKHQQHATAQSAHHKTLRRNRASLCCGRFTALFRCKGSCFFYQIQDLNEKVRFGSCRTGYRCLPDVEFRFGVNVNRRNFFWSNNQPAKIILE